MNYSNAPPCFETAVTSKLIFKTKVKALNGFSLLETKQQEGSYTLHPVVQDWCHYIAVSNNLADQLHELAFISVGITVPSNSDRRYAEIEQRLLPHANYLINSERGKLKEAKKMYQQALAGRERASGPNHTSTLNTVNNLGILYSDQGKQKEAEEMYQRALAGKEKALGPDHTSTLNIVNNLGLIYFDQAS
ncbi:hypothetical protein BJX62DRAFT_243609 [Aspergillus germanicus]